jgi:hypothetical protein
VRWRWRAQGPVQIVGVAHHILIVREKLANEGYGDTYRITGLDSTTGHRRWQLIKKNLSYGDPEIYARLLLLFQPNGVYATGVHLILDVVTGKTVVTSDGDLIVKKPDELLWVNTPGMPPHHSSDLELRRVNPQTVRAYSLSLPVPKLPGIGGDEHPTKNFRVNGDRIEIIYGGYKNSPDGKSSEAVYYLVRYKWSAGAGQKPEIIPLDKPDWPR